MQQEKQEDVSKMRERDRLIEYTIAIPKLPVGYNRVEWRKLKEGDCYLSDSAYGPLWLIWESPRASFTQHIVAVQEHGRSGLSFDSEADIETI
jgi:hypothetical protein